MEELGAAVSPADRWGGTPLRDAVREGHHPVAELLRQHGGNLGKEEAEAASELGELAAVGSLKTLKLAEACGMQINEILKRL